MACSAGTVKSTLFDARTRLRTLWENPMTDEHMDARLRAAGERWRADNEAAAGVDVAATVAASETEILAPAPRRPRHWGLFASAAVVTAALVVGGALVLPGGDHPTGNPELNNAGLVGRVWELVGYEDADLPSQSPPGPPPQLQLRDSSNATFYIGPDGQLVADDSCAVLGAKADVGSGQLTVTDQVVRYRSCTDTVGDMVFTSGRTDVLDGTADYQIDGNSMTISRAGDDDALRRRAAGPPGAIPRRAHLCRRALELVRVFDADGNALRSPATSRSCRGRRHADCERRLQPSHRHGDRDRPGRLRQRRRHRDRLPAGRSCDPGRARRNRRRAGQRRHDDPEEGRRRRADLPMGAGRQDRIRPAGARREDLAVELGRRPAGGLRRELKVNGTTYTANDGCHEFTGGASVEPGTVAFTGVPTDNPPCGGAGAEQASTFDSFLSTAGLWAIRDGNWSSGTQPADRRSHSCSPAGSNPPPTVTNPGAELIGRDWYLVQVAQDSGGTASGHSVTGRLLLRIGGNGGVLLSERCAQGDGTVTFTDSTADFSGIDLTDHSCPYAPVNTDLSEPDTAIVLEVLTGRTTWSLHGDQLSFSRNGSTLTFGPDAPVAAPPYGRKWMLDSREEGNSGMSYDWVSADVAPYLVFDSQGSFTGRDGCVQLSGTVDVQDKTLSFTDVHRDSSGCADKPVTYLNDILTTDLTWSVERGRLDLTVGDLTLGFLHL